MQIERLAVERRLIDLEVAGVEQHALRRPHDHRDTVGHAVRDADELERERADRNRRARLDLDRLGIERVFFELVLDECPRQPGSPYTAPSRCGSTRAPRDGS